MGGAARLGGTSETPGSGCMKIAQLCAVDFALPFHLPLMRGMRDARHEVVGIANDSPLLARCAEGFRVEPVAIERSFNLLRHRKSARELKAVQASASISFMHTPVAALIGRWAAWRASAMIAYTAHGFYFHERMAWQARRLRGARVARRTAYRRAVHASGGSRHGAAAPRARADHQAIGNVDATLSPPRDRGARKRAAFGASDRPVI